MDERIPSSTENPLRSEDENLDNPLMSKTEASSGISSYKQITSHLSIQERKSKNATEFFSIKKELIPLKIVLICWFGAIACVMPYMTIYFKQLGITANETAFIYSFYPLAKMMGPSLGGLIADKLGRYKPILYTSLVFTIVFCTGFLLISPIPDRTCQNDEQIPCWRDDIPETPVELCCPKIICTPVHGPTEEKKINCDLKCKEIHDGNNSRIKIHKLCLNVERQNACVEENSTFNETKNQYKNKSIDFCPYTRSILNNSEVSLCLRNNKHEDCSRNCNVTIPDISNVYQCKENWYIRLPTLALTLFIFMSFHIFVAICFSLVDTITLTMVKKQKDDYGRQRFWSILSTAVFSPVTGLLVDVASKNKTYTNYSPAFYLFDVLIVFNIIFVYILDLPIAPKPKKIRKNIVKLLKSIDIIVFLAVIFFLGSFLGFMESFLFWHLLDLGSPKYLLGLAITIGSLAGLPFLYISSWFVNKCGRANLLVAAFVFYFIRCFGYSYIYNPWWLVLFQTMEASTSHLMWVAAVTYAATIAPKGLLATVQGCVAGMHFGIGRGSGTIIGGNLITAFGNRIAFRSMGVTAGIIGIMYALFHWIILRKKERQIVSADDVQEQTQEIGNEVAIENIASL